MRIISLDVLRGIAVLGILFMNIYHHGDLLSGYVQFPVVPLSDTVIETFNTLFVDGRFRTLFCLLFGAGLAIQYQSSVSRGFTPNIWIRKRLNWLLFFGFLHAVFIFGGDVLMMYAVSAIMIYKKLSNNNPRALLNNAIGCIVIGMLLTIALTYTIEIYTDSEPLRNSTDHIAHYEQWFGHYGNQVLYQGGFALIFILLSPFFLFWQVAGLMFLGAYLYRIGFFQQGLSRRQFITILAVGVTTTIFTVLARRSGLLTTGSSLNLTSSVSAVFIALIYADLVVKALKKNSRFLTLFASPGKIAFTLYISQSIIMAVLLRWVFPEFHLTASRLDYVSIAASFTVVQVLFAHIYLQYFNQGPLEALWRKAYLNSVMKKQQADEAKLADNSG
ncbi:DUF418 domain-containing protein [Veronia pacifica]|uniref:DUF418 domain-containing protein n=1 Tax=Veronia pacifica TaxID=1080227 RepID=A0A1C3ECH8_9GAMM|nr:DUF418 domain-containing protein [Veronia pacifica]ODA30952.1 hypothetical protein A8L45_18635 [Veronia pacifica]